MSYLDWHVGMKVVCTRSAEEIAEKHRLAPSDSVYPESNKVYTIRELRDDAPWRFGKSVIVVLLDEISNAHLIGRPGYIVEPGFNPEAFRPVQPRKTDISIFTAMLHDEPRKVDA